MKNLLIKCCCALLALTSCNTAKKTVSDATPPPIPAMMPTVTYPTTRTDAVSDNYHGTTVADPYRWLEDDNSDETKAWVKTENAVTYDYLAKIPFRDAIHKRFEKIWNFERYGVPFKEGANYYFYKNDGLQNQAVLYKQAKLDGEASVLIDPNTLSNNGTVALGGMAFNRDGSLMALQLSEAGSDWNVAQVMDIKTGKMLTDTLHWLKFSGLAWYRDGFFYSRYPEPAAGDALKGKAINHKLYYHKVGTSQADDELFFSDAAHPDHNFGAGVTDDERFLVVSVSESTSGNMLYVRDLSVLGAKNIQLVANFDNDYDVVDNVGDNLLILTNYGAPNQRLVSINPAMSNQANWKTIIPENADDVLQGVQILGNKLVANYLHNAASQVKIFSLDGKFEREITLPTVGTVGGISGKREENTAFYSFTSFTYPTTIFKLDLSTGESTVFKAPTVDFDPTAYETKQIWYNSKDGTKVPMFVTHKKGLVLDGNNPTLLYGYGGFNISVTPSFSVSRLVFLENGGVYVVANIRGGGEFGEKWHKAGTKERKQNVFDDFIGAAEFLIAQGYTSPQKLAIEGGSNGGLLVGACMTQRPDLFKVAIPRVGVLDMLRYHQFTIGRAWSIDYGLSEDPTGFAYLYKYSPLHNLKPVAYPATLVMTGDHDDRVVPAHSFKFAAALQANQKGSNPALIRIDLAAGHGAGKPTSKLIDEAADANSFMMYNLGVKL